MVIMDKDCGFHWLKQRATVLSSDWKVKFRRSSWKWTRGNVREDGAQPGDTQRIVELGQFGSRGRGRRGAGGREKGNGKETEFWRRGERRKYRFGRPTSNWEGATTTKWAGQTAQLGAGDKYETLWCEKIKKHGERRRRGRPRMNEIKITMERCSERFPRPPPLLLLLPLTEPRPGGQTETGLHVHLTRSLQTQPGLTFTSR